MLEIQVQDKAISQIARKSRPAYAEFTGLLVRGDDKERALAMRQAVGGLFTVLTSGQISKSTFDKRLSRLIELDVVTNPSGIREPSATIKALTELIEGDQTEEFAKQICATISTNVMKKDLDYLDADWCSPQRMADYLRNEEFYSIVVKPDGDASAELEFLLGKCVERDEDPEEDFLGEVSAALAKYGLLPGDRLPRNRATKSFLVESLQYLEKHGCEAASVFLERVWLDQELADEDEDD